MLDVKRPGVYVEEIAKFPPSVAQVSTAIPAFFGYTERCPQAPIPYHDQSGSFIVRTQGDETFTLANSPFGTPELDDFQLINLDKGEIKAFDPNTKTLTVNTTNCTAGTAFSILYNISAPKPVRISNMLDYESIFGKAKGEQFLLKQRTDGSWKIKRTTGNNYLLVHLLKHYFDNGGGDCYVVSVGTYDQDTFVKEDFIQGLAALKKEDLPTLIVLGDAINLPPEQYYALCQQSLKQCTALGDRFAILDVLRGDETAETFRNNIGQNDLKYGAAYTPHLLTTLTYGIEDTLVTVDQGTVYYDTDLMGQGLRISYSGEKEHSQVLLEAGISSLPTATVDNSDPNKSVLSLKNVDGATAWNVLTASGVTNADLGDFELFAIGSGAAPVPAMIANALTDSGKILKIPAGGTDEVLLLIYSGTIPSASVSFGFGTDWDFLPQYDDPNQPTKITLNITAPGTSVRVDDLLAAYAGFTPFPDCTLLKIGQGGIMSADAIVDQPMEDYLYARCPATGEGMMILYPGSTPIPQLQILAPTPTFNIPTPGTGAPIKLIISELGAGVFPETIVKKWTDWTSNPSNDPQGFALEARGDTPVVLEATPVPDSLKLPTLADFKTTKPKLYNELLTQLSTQYITLPPSGAVAGIYATVDRNRGVWKAPANVSVASVIGPEVKFTDSEHDELNMDQSGGGKSINAIRNYAGKGTLVMGARTLAGNDNEWRYVSVRRLFNMIEESTKKSSELFVFEPNNATTWLKVRGMIEAYLTGLWQQGALAGPTPQAAFYVNVGLGKTMTQQDILEGRMNVEIGIAAVRPAEFIILRFSHKMQEA